MLPVEIKDKIFLYLDPWSDFETLDCCRELQSSYIRHLTQFNDINKAAQIGNVANMKYLILWSCVPLECIPCFSLDRKNEILNYYLQKNRPLHKPFTKRIKLKNINIDNLMWLMENGCDWNKVVFAVFISLVNRKDMHFFVNQKWLLSNMCPYCAYTITLAITIGNVDAILFDFRKQVHIL